MATIGPITFSPGVHIFTQTDNVVIRIDSTVLEAGTLYVADNSLCWKPNSNDCGIAIPWSRISLHAIGNVPEKCIYAVLDFILIWPGYRELPNRNGLQTDDDEDEGNVADQECEITEIWFCPSDPNVVEEIYEAMTRCQVLHPDAEALDNVLSSDEEQGYMEGDDEGDFANGGVGDGVQLRNLNLNDERFADADED